MLEARKGAQPAKSHGEGRDAQDGLLEGGHDLGELLLGLITQEAECHMQVVRRHPGDRTGKRAEPVHLGRDGPPRLLGEEDADEGPRHQPRSRRRSMSRAA